MSVEFERFKEMRENPEESAATMIEFTDEEGYGRFLDLHELYEIFINIKGIPVSFYFLPPWFTSMCLCVIAFIGHRNAVISIISNLLPGYFYHYHLLKLRDLSLYLFLPLNPCLLFISLLASFCIRVVVPPGLPYEWVSMPLELELKKSEMLYRYGLGLRIFF